MDHTRLLVIEDDPDIRALLAEFLGREGYEVRALGTGRLATQTIDGFAPALVILDIMLRLRDEHGISFLYITHDLSTAYQIGDEMVILFQGVVAERGHTVEIIENPKHPYVQELIASIPAPNPKRKWDTDIKLPPEDATRLQPSRGCHFYARCSARMERCRTEMPPLYSVGGNGHQASCFLYEAGAAR